MPTTVALDTPKQVAMTGTWVELTIPASVRGIVLTFSALGYYRWSGVAEGDAIGTGYSVAPAGMPVSRWLPGTNSGHNSTFAARSVFVAAANGATLQAEVVS